MRSRLRNYTAATIGGLLLASGALSAQEPTPAPPPPHAPSAPRLPAPAPIPVQGRGWLGFAYRIQATRFTVDRNGTRTEEEHITVGEVLKGSPADKAGMEPGDTLVKLNGEPVTARLISATVRKLHPGDAVRLQVRRGGKLVDLTLHAGERPAYLAWEPFPGNAVVWGVPGDSIRHTMRIFMDSARLAMDSMRFPHMVLRNDSMMIMRFGNNGRADTLRLPRMDSLRVHMKKLGRNMDSLRIRMDLPGGPEMAGRTFEVGVPQPFAFEYVGRRAIAGAELQELNDQLASYFGVREGLLVEHVAPGTPAAKAGLQAGDIVIAADGRAVGDVADLRRALRGREGTLKLDVSRKGKQHTLQLKWP